MLCLLRGTNVSLGTCYNWPTDYVFIATPRMLLLKGTDDAAGLQLDLM
jgi:hypothetical protein